MGNKTGPSGANPSAIDIRNLIMRRNRQNESQRPLSDVFNLFVHYSEDTCPASASQSEEIAHCNAIADYHERKGWGPGGTSPYGYTMMYTYAVFQSGRIYLVNNEDMLLWNTMNGNSVGLATVCILGAGELPSIAMQATLLNHLDYMSGRADIPAGRENVWGHGECGGMYGGGPAFGNATACPGKALLPIVRSYRQEVPVGPPPPPPPPAPDPDRARRFPTGWYLSHGFLAEYERLEGYRDTLATRILGFPISPEFTTTLTTGIGQSWTGTVQYFERGRMEYHPENKTPYDIEYGLLGGLAMEQATVVADPHA